MAIKMYDGTVLTPNEFAKVAVRCWGEGASYWMERYEDSKITECEHDLINAAVEKQIQRLEALFNNDKLKKVFF